MLEVCARRGLSDEAEALYREELFPACGPADATTAWGTECEDLLWQSIFALRLRACVGGFDGQQAVPAEQRERRRHRAAAVLEDVRQVCPQLRAEAPLAGELRSACRALGWRCESPVRVGADGLCPVTGQTLQAESPNE